MKPFSLFVVSVFVCLGVLGVIVFLMHPETAALLSPQGLVAEKELTLITNIVLLMLIVTVSVFALTFFFAWWYRASNTRAVYMPNWEHGAMNELVWWAIPIEIVLVLGALTWSSTHDLDPRKALEVSGAPLTIQVVALPWKWLFIYPHEDIATVNDVRFPINRPVTFHITADAPMNSFWIPELGGQIYAMTGMSTELNLIADHVGTFEGRSANYSGAGFAHMDFAAIATSQSDFDSWVASVRQLPQTLSLATYTALAKPSEASPPTFYAKVADNLYDIILMKFGHATPEAMHVH